MMKGCRTVHSLKPQLHGLVGRRNELKDLVRYKCSVRALLSRRVDNIARAKSDLLGCDFRNRDIRRYGDRLGAVLIAKHKRGTRYPSGLFRSSYVSAIRKRWRPNRWSFCCERLHLGGPSERYLPQPHSTPREI
jgi:hypothetical protein